MKSRQNNTVVVAMSGGVDSSVAAALLVQQGYDVIGVTMNLWDYDRTGGNVNLDSGCCSVDTMDDARCVSSRLGIPHYVVSFREEFESAVTENFISEYLQGRTPNPCVRCNTFIKWGSLLTKAEQLGAEKIATGHYARSHFDDEKGRHILRCGVDGHKDQSYALWGIRQNGLAQTLFPVGQFTKAEIRAQARELGLRTAEKRESQEICFIPDNDYGRYLRKQRPELEQVDGGEIVNRDGKTVGHHQGYPFYTIGQRKGLGLTVPEPVYVTEIQAGTNRVQVGEPADLEHSGVVAESVNWVSIDEPQAEIQVQAKIRYNSPAAPARLKVIAGGGIELIFDEVQRAVTPGQSVVLYQDDLVAGGGVIKHAISRP